MLENSEGKVKKKIVININSSKAKTSESNLNSHYQSQNPKCEKNKVVDELPKLL